MFKLDKPITSQRSSLILLIVCLCVFCAMFILGPLSLDSTSRMLNNPTIEQLSIDEFEEELFVFAFFVPIIAGLIADQLRTHRLAMCTNYPSTQLPPPK